MDREAYIPYLQIAQKLGIERGMLLWLAADLTGIAMLARRMEGSFDPGKFIDSFVDLLGPDGTLAIPAFNFNLRNKNHYSLLHTVPMTGALAVHAMRMGKFSRTQHPLHSFLVVGKDTERLTGLKNKSSFGTDSPFGIFYNYQAKMAIFGTSVSNAFTFVHFLEESMQVRYRRYQTINIFNEDSHRWEAYQLYAKKPGWTMDMDGLERLLIQKGIARRIDINGISGYSVDLASSYPVIQEDILQNHARNIARFSPKLFCRDVVKSMLESFGFQTATDKIHHAPGVH